MGKHLFKWLNIVCMDKIAGPKLVQLCARKAWLKSTIYMQARKQECNISGRNMTPPKKKI